MKLRMVSHFTMTIKTVISRRIYKMILPKGSLERLYGRFTNVS